MKPGAARTIIVFLLVSVLALAGSKKATERLQQTPLASHIEVKLNDGHKLRGRLKALDAKTYEMEVSTDDALQYMTITYAETKSVRSLEQDPYSAGGVAKRAAVRTGVVIGVYLAVLGTIVGVSALAR